MAALLIAAPALAGDLTVDNLTVSSNAVIYEKLSFDSTVSETNGSNMATGGAITTNGDYIIHAFTNIGTTDFIVSGGSLDCEVLIVAGGGGGAGSGGGGGAGGLIYLTSCSISGTSTVTVGAGGGGVPQSSGRGTNGANTVFGTNTAFGGGGGGAGWTVVSGAAGGSGGGAGQSGSYAAGGAGTNGQGNAGGNNYNGGNYYGGGGGGGAGTVGTNGTASVGGNGGEGLEYSQFASVGGSPAGWFAGGGGAGILEVGTGGSGGKGGGGNGSNGQTGQYPTDGTANTGGGAGSPGQNNPSYTIGANGGSGIVIVRYPMTTSSNITSLSISSNGISQTSASGSNVFMGKVGIGTNNPAEQLHVVGNVRVDGTSIVSAITLGEETRTDWPTGNLSASNNLSDIDNQAAARANLGLGSAATNDASAFLASAGDGSQLTGITAEQVGALSTNAGALIAANNLSDVANAGTSRSNLGLGSAATNEASAFLSTSGGEVNGNIAVNGSVSVDAAAGDIPMGVYTNQ